MKKIIRIVTVVTLFFLDFIFMPWTLSIIIYYIRNFQQGFFTAYQLWLDSFSVLYFLNLFKDSDLLKLWGLFQFLFLIFIYHVVFDRPGRRKNKINSDLGGPESSGSGEHGTSRWMTRSEVSKKFKQWDCISPINKSGTPLGIEITGSDINPKYNLIYDEDDWNTLLIASTRTGKSRRVFLPKIWLHAKAGESMVITDPKGELYRRSHKYLRKNGYKIILMDFRNPERSNRHNYMQGVVDAFNRGDHSKAVEEAWNIANTIVNKKDHSSGDPLWANGEESTIAALILAVAYEAESDNLKNMGSVYSLFYKFGVPDEEGRLLLLEYINSFPDTHPAKAAFAPAATAPYRTKASFFTSAAADLRLWALPSIVYMSAVQDHDISAVCKEKTAVFLVIPDESSTKHFLANLYIKQVYNSLVNTANRSVNGRIPIRVNFELDEFGNLPTIPDFPSMVTVALGRGIRFTLGIQDLSQIEDKYGKLARTIQGNCQIWLYLRTTDLESMKYISQLTGEYTISTQNTSSNVRNVKDYSTGTSEGTAGRFLLTPDEVKRWEADTCLVLTGGNFPAKLPLPDLSKWIADKELDIDTDMSDFDKPIPIISTWTPKFELIKINEKEENKTKPKTKKKEDKPKKEEDFTTLKDDTNDDKNGNSIMDMID